MGMLMELASTVVSWKCGTMATGMAVLAGLIMVLDPAGCGGGKLLVFNVTDAATGGGLRDSGFIVEA
jgi:hypothetical protein